MSLIESLAAKVNNKLTRGHLRYGPVVTPSDHKDYSCRCAVTIMLLQLSIDWVRIVITLTLYNTSQMYMPHFWLHNLPQITIDIA